MALTAQEVFRDYPTDGVPSSGVHEPKKSEIRTLLGQYEQIINAFTSNGGLIYDTRALLYADLAKDANRMAWVIGDSTTAYNGIYKKVGASGSGSWTRVADLPYSFIVASDDGAGTPDAIVATSSLPVSGSALVLLNVYEANTGSPVTVSFNGGSPLTVKTNSGNDVAPGGLVPGMLLVGRVSGSTFRLVSDQASAAVLAAAEDAATRAEMAESNVIGLLGGVTPVFATKALAEAYAPDIAPGFLRLAGYASAADLGGALYKLVASEPSHAGKFSITLSDGVTVAWYEIAERILTPRLFGAISDLSLTAYTGTDNGAALRNMLACSKAQGGKPMVIDGQFGYTGSLVVDNSIVSITGAWFSGAVLAQLSPSATSDGGLTINQDDYRNSTHLEGFKMITKAAQTAGRCIHVKYSASDSLNNRNKGRCYIEGVSVEGHDVGSSGWWTGLTLENVHNATVNEFFFQGRRDLTLPNTDPAHWEKSYAGIELISTTGMTSIPCDITLTNVRAYHPINGIVCIGDFEGLCIDKSFLVAVRTGINHQMASERPWLQVTNTHVAYRLYGINAKNCPQANFDNLLLYRADTLVDTIAIFLDNCPHSQYDNIRCLNMSASFSGHHDAIVLNNSTAVKGGSLIHQNGSVSIGVYGTSGQCRFETVLRQGIYPGETTAFLQSFNDGSTGGQNQYGDVLRQTTNSSLITATSSGTQILNATGVYANKGDRLEICVQIKGNHGATAGFVQSAVVLSSGDGGVGVFGLTGGNMAQRTFGVTGDWEQTFSGIFSCTQTGTFNFPLVCTSTGSDSTVAANNAQITVRRL